MNENIITAVFGATRETKVRPRYRYDQGQVLIVRGVKNLPDFYEVHFANEGSTADATPLIGTTDGVTIPDSYFQSGATIYAYIYVHDEATDGTTVYKVTIPIINRARPANVEPTPEQEDIISQAIVALNENVGRAEDAAEQAEESVAVAQSAAYGAAQAERHAGTHATRAIGASQAAQASESNALSSATTAQEAAQSALESSQNASGYADAAGAYADDASRDKNLCETYYRGAMAYAGQANTARDSAQAYANNAYNSELAAGTAASNAATAQAAAASAATNAGNAKTAAEAAQTAAEIAATNAQTYAGQAQQSATNAGQSATSAAQTLTQVQTEGATQITAIDTEGQRVLDSIPSDYTQMEQDVTGFKSQITELGNGYTKLNVTEYIANKSLSTDGKSEIANNYRYLSDFIPVTPGENLYFYITATTERCAFYTSADYATVTGGTFTVAAGSPTIKVVPANAAYIIIGWHKNNGIPNVEIVAPFIDDTAGNGALNKVWSANKLANDAANVSAAITAEDTKITAIIEKSQFETVNATIETGSYYKKDGTRGGGSSYRTATTNVTPGEILEVSGYTLKGTAFVLVVYFDANDNFLSYAYENANVSAETYTDLAIVVPEGAAKIGVNCMNANASLAIKRLENYASMTDIDDVNSAITNNKGKILQIGKYVNFNNEPGTFAYGFYHAISGVWTPNNSYGTITFPASYGDLFLVTGTVVAAAGFALVLVFDANNAVIDRVYDGRYISERVSVTDMPLYIANPNAAWVAILGSYYDSNQYYPRAKRAVTPYAHVLQTGVCFGDSTFGNSDPKDDIPAQLKSKTGNNVFNGAFGGCRMSSYSGNYGAFSMYKLADAICTGVWTDQDAAMADPSFEPPAYAAQHLANLKGTDFAKVDFITIAYGTNDWRAGKPLDNEQNPTDTNTIAGALRYSLDEIMATYPQIDVYVLCPLWRVVMLEGDTEDNPTGYCDITPNGLPVADQYYLMDVCDVLKKVADEYHVTFINDFDIGINKYNWKTWLVDGTHPTKAGQKLMVGNMIKNIKNLLP